MTSKPARPLSLVLSALLIPGLVTLALAACSDSSAAAPLETRVFQPVQQPDLRKVSSRERLGAETPGNRMGQAHGGMQPGGEAGQGEDPRKALSFTVPQGWTELPPAMLRIVNLRVGGDPKGECYLTFLSGAGGGAKANIDRWRNQLGLGPLSEAEIESLPRIPMFGHEAPLMVAEGEFTAFDGTKSPGFALAGVILPRDGQAMSVKMTGPKELVTRELANFKLFVASLGPAKPESATQSGDAAKPQRPAADSRPAANQPASGSDLAWTAPATWKQGEARQFREVTYFPEGASGTECWISKAMGSLDANLTRWRNQFGKGPLTSAELAALPTWNVLGVASKVVEIQGPYKGAMDGKAIDDALMIGVICERAPQSIFIRITGPRAEVERERANFEKFCKSLR